MSFPLLRAGLANVASVDGRPLINFGWCCGLPKLPPALNWQVSMKIETLSDQSDCSICYNIKFYNNNNQKSFVISVQGG